MFMVPAARVTVPAARVTVPTAAVAVSAAAVTVPATAVAVPAPAVAVPAAVAVPTAAVAVPAVAVGVPAVAVTVCGATVVAMAVLGDVLAFVLGTSARGVLREGIPAMVVGRVCLTDKGPEDIGAARVLEVTLSVVPSLVVGMLVFVMCGIVSAVTLVEFRVVVQVPVVSVTGEGGTGAALSIDVLSDLRTASPDMFCFTALGHLLVTKCRGSAGTVWLLDKGTEEIHTSTRAVHILLGELEVGLLVSERLGQPAL